MARRERSCFIRSWGCGGTSFTRRQMATIVIIMITVNNTNFIVIGHQQSQHHNNSQYKCCRHCPCHWHRQGHDFENPIYMVFSTIIIVIVNFSDFFNTFTDWCYKNCLTFGVDFLSKESIKKMVFFRNNSLTSDVGLQVPGR